MSPRALAAALVVVGLTGCLLPDEASDGPSPGRDATHPDAVTPDRDLSPDAAATPSDATPSEATPPDARPPADAAPPPDMAPPFEPTADRTCPGDEGCPMAVGTELRAGASARVISDLLFEIPRREFLRPGEHCNEEQQTPDERCGVLTDNFMDNCGTDALCEGAEGYPGPDPDGTEGDRDHTGRPYFDYFRDCGLDRLCPEDADYPGPDEGEGNQHFDGLWMAGFAFNRPAMGIRDPTWARTIALEQGETLVTITAIDAVGIFFSDVERIRARARELLAERMPEMDLDLIVITATHSHEVPDTTGLWAGEVNPDIPIPLESAVSPRYIGRVREQAALSIVEAVANLQPTQLRVARGFTGADGLIHDSRQPIIINDEVGVAHFTDLTGETIATLVNWGNHPEALDSDNNMISSDFPGALRDAIEGGVPETVATIARPGLGGVAIFLQGTVGGLMTPLHTRVLDLQGNELDNTSFFRNDVIGWRVAAHALDALEGDDAVDAERPALRFSATAFKVPVHNRVYHLAFIAGLFDRELLDFDDRLPINDRNLPNVLTEIAVVRLGPLTLYTVPGELFPELAIGGYDGAKSFGHPVVNPDDPNAPDLSLAPGPPYLNDTMPGDYPWVLGLGMDELGYLVPEYDYVLHPVTPYLREPEGDHYEETNSVGPEIVPRVLHVLTMLADQLSAGQ